MIKNFDIKIKSISIIRGIKFKIFDAISKLFEIEVIFEAEENSVNLISLINEEATIILTSSKEKYFHGIIQSIEMEDIDTYKVFDKRNAIYKVMIRPRLFLLSKTNSYKIFQKKSTNKIIEEILKQHQIEHKNKSIKSGIKVNEFCVQYNESDLNFINRLMEEEGMFFYFEQSKDSHTLVIKDNHNEDFNIVDASFYNFNNSIIHDIEKINSLKIKNELVSKKIKILSYDYLKPQKINNETIEVECQKKYGEIKFDHINQSDLSDIASIYKEIENSNFEKISGSTTCFDLVNGSKLKLKQHPINSLNSKKYFLTQLEECLTYTEENHQIYCNNFVAIDDKSSFKTNKITPHPIVYGIETATVIGDKEGEVNTNENGEIKIKFHWDESTEKESSCWIRVMQKSAGNNHGHIQIPRIGQEVIVSFIKGNPNFPIIMGSLYNGKNKPKYLPQSKTIDSWTSTSIGSNSDKNFNEIKFENKHENEEIYIHAEKDFKTEIKNNYDITTQEGYMHINLKKGDFLLQLDESNILIDVKKGKITIKSEQDIDIITQKNMNFLAKENISIKSDKNITIEAKEDISINSKNLTVKIVEKLFSEAKNIFKKAIEMINFTSKNTEINSNMDLNIKNTNTKIKSTLSQIETTNFKVKSTSTEIESKANFTAKSNGKAVVKGTIVELG